MSAFWRTLLSTKDSNGSEINIRVVETSPSIWYHFLPLWTRHELATGICRPPNLTMMEANRLEQVGVGLEIRGHSAGSYAGVVWEEILAEFPNFRGTTVTSGLWREMTPKDVDFLYTLRLRCFPEATFQAGWQNSCNMHSGSLWNCAVLATLRLFPWERSLPLSSSAPRFSGIFLSVGNPLVFVLTKTLSVRPASKKETHSWNGVLFELDSAENCNEGRAGKLFPCHSPRMSKQWQDWSPPEVHRHPQRHLGGGRWGSGENRFGRQRTDLGCFSQSGFTFTAPDCVAIFMWKRSVFNLFNHASLG